MANATHKDASGATRYTKTSGDGTDVAPFVGHVNVDGTVELAAATLAALETVTAVLSGAIPAGSNVIGSVLTRDRLVTATRRDVAASATAADLFPAGTNYHPGSHAYNATTEPFYVNEGGTNPTTAVYGEVINPGETYVMDVPFNNQAVRFICPTANGGFIRVTDYTS